MIISVNWLKKFTDIDVSTDELVSLIGERLVEIEGVESLGDKYKDVVVAKVVESSPLEGSDHLNVVKLDDGGARKVERDENGYVQVVCGAPNVRAGLLVAWLPPASVVPETFGDEEPFVLGAKPLRGVMSNGMIASARELDLYDEHEGILEIDQEVAPGSSFAELYELNDHLLDIENKSLTHRPDAFGVIGFAREVAAIQGKAFNDPEWLNVLSPVFDESGDITAPVIKIEDAELSDRFQAIVLTGIDESKKSPIQLQTYLARSGVRPVSASVDVSNYLMLLTGQPSHAYDYDKVRKIAGDDFTIRVRSAYEGEKLVLLDGKEATLDKADIVIAAGDTAIGLAGVMGGASTAVDAETKVVLLEAATFNLYSMRSAQMRHGIFSEAVTRFTKGVPAPLSSPVITQAVSMLSEYMGARAASGIVEDYPGEIEPIVVKVTSQDVNNVLGTQFSSEDIASVLGNVGFKVEFNGLEASVTVPYWRKDISIPEDIIEEVGRITGFDTINPTLPRRDFVAVEPSAFDTLRSSLRSRLVRAGSNEVLTYSFVHSDILKKSGQDLDNAYRIINSISPDLQYYRQSLTPSLLNRVHQNIKSGYSSFALFELNKVHRKLDGMTIEGVPEELNSLGLVVIDTRQQGDAYYAAKRLLEYAVEGLGLKLKYKPLVDISDAAYRPFEPKRSAVVIDEISGKELGIVGEYKKSVQKAFKLPEYAAGFEVLPTEVLEASKNSPSQYSPLSRYPGTERDICFQVSSAITYEDVAGEAKRALAGAELESSVSPVDIYQGDDTSTKNVTIRIGLVSHQKTLTNDDVSVVINNVIDKVKIATEGVVI